MLTSGYMILEASNMSKAVLLDSGFLIRLMNPKYIEVVGLFLPRGGISIYPYANYGRPGTKYEQMAQQRLMNHEIINIQ